MGLIVVATLAFTNCSNTGSNNAETTNEPSPATATPLATPTSPSDSTSVALANLTGGKTVELTTRTLPAAPTGFNDADLEAFGDRAVDLIRRGISPDVAALGEDEAFDYVFANQYRASTDELRAAFESISTEFSYAWVVASRFEQPPATPAKVLAARWQVATSEAESVEGTAPVLQVILSAAVEHRVPVSTDGGAAGATVPIVVQRTVIIRGFKPRGGPRWAPSVGYQANVFLGGKCALVNGGILTPATRPSTIKEDLRDLGDYLNKPKTITPATSADNDLRKFVAKYCEDVEASNRQGSPRR